MLFRGGGIWKKKFFFEKNQRANLSQRCRNPVLREIHCSLTRKTLICKILPGNASFFVFFGTRLNSVSLAKPIVTGFGLLLVLLKKGKLPDIAFKHRQRFDGLDVIICIYILMKYWV